MSGLITFIAQFLRTEISQSFASQQIAEARPIFRGLPSRMMERLLDELGGSSGLRVSAASGEARTVPVYLVASGVVNPSGLASGKCTDAHLVSIRNAQECRCFLTLLPPGVVVNESISSSATYYGVQPSVDRGDLSDDPFVQELIEFALERTEWSRVQKEAAFKVVAQALIDASRHDIGAEDCALQWEVMERLFEICERPNVAPELLLAALGFPPCEPGELGTKQHLSILERAGQEMESQGVASAFLAWSASIPDLEPDLSAAEQFLRSSSSDGFTFARSPSAFYRLPMPWIRSGELPGWWRSLSLARWNELLQADVTPERTLRVTAARALVSGGSGLPFVFQACVAFELSVGDDDADGTVIRAFVAKGARDFLPAGEVVLSGRTGVFGYDAVPDHQAPLRFRFESEGYAPVLVRVIVLDRYSVGVVVHSRSALKHSLFKPVKRSKGEFECDLELPGVGSHHLDILHGTHVRVGAIVTSHDACVESSEPTDRPINVSDAVSAAALIETDDESTHEFSADVNGEGMRFRLYIRAADVPPVGAASEFDRLLLEHRSVVRRSGSASRVERVPCRADDLQRWILEDPNSFHPLVLGEDYLRAWSAPRWADRPILSQVPMQHDPRPEARGFRPPDRYLEARANVQEALRCDSAIEDLLEMAALGERMRDEKFRGIVDEYLSEYVSWLNEDYESAAWADLMSVHRVDKAGATLGPYPHAVLLTPLHPLRFGWQCVAQALLQHAIDQRLRCPAASILDPRSTPDCFLLPCRTPVGTTLPRVFLSVASSSDYWGVLWSGESDHLRALDDESGRLIFDGGFGITIDGLATGFSVPQVERAIDEVAQIWSAKSTIRVSVSSDTRGSSSCNEGIASWARKTLGEQDPWCRGGRRSLEVFDERPEDLQPEDAELSTLTQTLDASIRWYRRREASPQADLAIVEHLGTQNPELHRQGLMSGIDAVGLNRVRVRRQLAPSDGRFIAESRLGKHAASPDAIEAIPEVARSASVRLASLTTMFEARCADVFDSYVFMPKRPTLERAIEAARYCAVSSSYVDPACFFSVGDSSYLWDYDLPSYSRRAGENNGFYLIASESPTILEAARGALGILESRSAPDDLIIKQLLREISKRGMPTLKRLAGGGSASLGEIGVLTCLRALQCEFADTNWPCILPVRVEGAPIVNLVIPIDPFRAYFDELRQGLLLQEFERPDLLTMSLRFEGDRLVGMKVTPIEVKARSESMTDGQLVAAIDQARTFAAFLEQLKKRASEHAIWGIAHRHLIASWLDYAFRVYGQLRPLMETSDWHKWHGEVLSAVLSGRVVPEIDSRGRLFVVGAANESEKRDLDHDGLSEALLISHADAFSLLTEPSSRVSDKLRSAVADWRLAEHSDPRSERDLAFSGEMGGAAQGLPALAREDSAPRATDAEGMESEPPQILAGSGSTLSAESMNQGIRFSVGQTVTTLEPHERFLHPSNTALSQLNIGIVGDLGVGKTQLIQALIYQFRRFPKLNRGRSPNFFIFDYKKDYSRKEFVEATGARVVKPEHLPLNLFDVRGAPEPSKAWLHRARCFIDILSRVYPGIGPVQQERLKNAVKDAYTTATHRSALAPTLYDVFDAYAHIVGDKLDAPYSIMSNMVDMELFARDPASVLPFAEFFSGPVVVDLGFLQDDDKTKNVVVAIMLNLFFAYMLSREKQPFIGSNPQLRFVDSFLLVDEASNIMQYEFDVLKKLLLQGREFGIGVMLASQYLSHFKTPNEDYREPLKTWFVHQVPNLGVKDLTGIGLTDVDQSLVDRVKGLANHHCLYKTFDVAGEIIRGKPFYELRI